MDRYIVAATSLCLFGWSAPASAECMARTVKDAREVDRALVVAIPAGETAEYAKLGFQPATCPSRNLAAYRDEMCRLSKLGNRAMQRRLEAVLGVSPARMCASAKALASTSIQTGDQSE